MHILLINNYTIRCGITAALVALANAMNARGHKVTILTQRPIPSFFAPFYKLYRKAADLSLAPDQGRPLPNGSESLEKMYALNDGITIETYKFSDKNLKIQKLRKRLKLINPDVCVCPLPDGSHIVWAATLLGTGIPYVYSEHHNPDTIENLFWTRKGRLAAMSGADAIHLLLPSYMESLPQFLRQKAVSIPNAVHLPALCSSPAACKDGRRILLWLGRLHEELKQCCMAIDTFALIANKYPDWDLHIAGDGQDRDLIEAHAEEVMKKQSLHGRIKLLGEKKDVWPEYASAHAFCFSSKTEGLPIALLEALASGLPAVAFSDCPGVTDVVEHEKNGLLAREMTAEALAVQLERLFKDDDLRKTLGENARVSLEKFSEKNVFDAWEKLLVAAAAKDKTEMEAFYEEPFASLSRLSSCARREWLWRDFGDPFPYSFEGFVKYAFNMPISWIKTRMLGRER